MIFSNSAHDPDSGSLSTARERGSIVVASGFFLVVFLMIAALGIDASRYMLKERKVQSVADGAVLAGGQAFNQFTDQPDLDRVRGAMFNYIRTHQTPHHLDFYTVKTSHYGEGYAMRALHTPAQNQTCTQGFALRNGKIVLTLPSTLKSRVLGSAITWGQGGSRVPVTTKTRIERRNQANENIEPWGDYDNPDDGNVNTGGSLEPYKIAKQEEGSTVTLHARSWNGSNPIIESESGDDQSLVLSNGDDVPEIGGMGDQQDAEEYVQDYINDQGKIELASNQAIVFFELGSTNQSSEAYDLQDLVLLVTVNPTSGPGAGTQNYYSTSAQGSQSSPCPPYPVGSYKIGVLTYGKAEPYFLPDEIFGTRGYGIVKHSVALVEPQPVYEAQNIQMNCGVYVDGVMSLPGNNFDAANTNFCGNSSINGGGSNNGTTGNIYHLEGSAVTPPGGGSGRIKSYPEPQPMPNFTKTNSSAYDVDLSNFDSWTDYGHCSGGGSTEMKALRPQGGTPSDIEWSRGPGDPVCVEKEGTDYVFQGNNNGTIQASDGSAISIYADGSVYFVDNGNALNGGLYATGDIVVSGNNYVFDGDPSVMGGLALWSEASIDIQKNSTTIRGILGAENSLTYGSEGGGTGPILKGVTISHGTFDLPSNSNNAAIDHDPTQYDPSFLSNHNWEHSSQRIRQQPRYSNVTVSLVG